MRDWLKIKRQERGLTCQSMAEQLGISAPMYSLIESGKRMQKMDVDTAVKLAQILRVPITKIIGYETRL